MPDISKIRLPGSNTDYNIKDTIARNMISGGITFEIVWTATDYASSTAPDATKLSTIPAGVHVAYNNGASQATGTLTASADTKAKFYLIYSKTQIGDLDVFDEYVTIESGTSYSWEKIGDTRIDLSNVVTGVTLNKTKDTVLGTGTSFTNSTSAVTFSGGASDVVLGEGTTFALTNGAVTVTPTTTNVKATASGGGAAWNSKDQKTVVTGYTIAAANKDTFVKSVSAETNKNLVTTSITPTDGTETVSKVTKTASKLVTTSIPNVTGNTSVTIPNVTSAGSASTWSFAMGDTTETAETLIISGANSTAPTLGNALTATNTTLGTAITAATGSVDSSGTGSDVVTAVTISDKTVAKQGSAVTVATGATATDGTGDAVVTGVTIGESADAIISLPDPSTATVIGSSATLTNTQPTVQLATGATAGTGVISVATGITSASVGTGITVGTNDKVTAITSVGTGTAAAQTITVGSNDSVDVATYDSLSLTVTKGTNE